MLIRPFYHRVPNGAGIAATLLKLPGLELYLDARAITGLTDGQSLTNWPDQGPFGANANVNNGTHFPIYKASASPNGNPAVDFSGADFPNAQQIGNAGLIPASEAGRYGFSLYAVVNPRNPAAASGGELLIEQWKGVQFVPRDANGNPAQGNYRWVDRAAGGSIEGGSQQAFQTGWQTLRLIFQPGTFNVFWTGVGDIYLNGAAVPMNVTSGRTYTLDGNTTGYSYNIGNLQANNVVGFTGQVAAILSYKGAHPASLQKFVDNVLRKAFGLSLL